MTVYVSDDVLDNLEFVKNNPDNSRLVDTALAFCAESYQCPNRFKVRVKDVDFITWYCPEHYHLAPWANENLDEWEN
jgi:hypothetical protein